MTNGHQQSTADCLQANIMVAGCGAMGWPMLKTLAAAGVNASGFDINPPAASDSDHRLLISDPLALRKCDILLVVVRDAAQIDELLFDEQAVYADGAGPPHLVICSTVAPDTIHSVRARLPAKVALIDAAISGAPYAAQQATLSFMLGGEDSHIQSLMPLFRLLGQQIVQVGESGRGMLAKVLNNYVAACGVVGVRRALARASHSGLDTATLRQIMRASSGANWYGDNLDRISWSRESYAPDNTIAIIEKDVRCALQACGSDEDPFDTALLEALRTLPDFPGD